MFAYELGSPCRHCHTSTVYQCEIKVQLCSAYIHCTSPGIERQQRGLCNILGTLRCDPDSVEITRNTITPFPALLLMPSLQKHDSQSPFDYSIVPKQISTMALVGIPGVSLYSDIEMRFRANLPSDFPEAAELFKCLDTSQAYRWIHTSAHWRSARATLEPRIEGMMKICQGFVKTVNTSQLFADEACDCWPALMLGSLALCIRVIFREF